MKGHWSTFNAEVRRMLKYYLKASPLLLNYAPWVNKTFDVLSPAALSRAAVDLHMTCIKTEGGACTPWSAKCWGVPYMLDGMHFLKLWQNLKGQKWMKKTIPHHLSIGVINCLKYPNSTWKDVIWSMNANCCSDVHVEKHCKTQSSTAWANLYDTCTNMSRKMNFYSTLPELYGLL